MTRGLNGDTDVSTAPSFGGTDAPVDALPDTSVPSALDALSRREIAVCEQLLRGQRVSGIARALELTEHTVRNHLHSIFRKTGARSQAMLIDILSHELPRFAELLVQDTRPTVRSIPPRQRAVLELIEAGHDIDTVADALGISRNTVRSHLRALFLRFRVASRTELVRAYRSIHVGSPHASADG